MTNDSAITRVGGSRRIVAASGDASPVLSANRGGDFESWLARAILKPKQSYLVHGGIDDTWPVDKNITAISLRDLMARLLSG